MRLNCVYGNKIICYLPFVISFLLKYIGLNSGITGNAFNFFNKEFLYLLSVKLNTHERGKAKAHASLKAQNHQRFKSLMVFVAQKHE